MTGQGEKFIDEHYLWGMVLNAQGDVIYSYKLPEELKHRYLMGDVAEFSRWYLDDYPVTTMQYSDGLIVLGNDKNSIWRSNISLKYESIILAAVLFLLTNVFAGMTLAYALSLKFSNNMQKIIDAIIKLEQNVKITVSSVGYLEDTAVAINHVSEKLNEQRQSIEKNKKMNRNWIKGVSHDIRTPLEIIVGNTEELIGQCKINDEIGKLKAIQTQAFKISELVQSLNLINGLDCDFQKMSFSRIHICKVVRECIADAMNIYDNKKYTFEIVNLKNSGDMMILADEKLLKRAFTNLIRNSIIHNTQGCKLTIIIKSNEKEVAIAFKDNGIGIDRFKAKELNGDYDGDVEKMHGWGLVVVKQILEVHQGKMNILESDKGAHIEVELPLDFEKLG